MKRLAILAGLVAATAAALPATAQTPLVDYEGSAKGAQIAQGAQWRIAFRLPGLSPEILAEADRLVAQASHEPEAEARRTLWRAATLLLGRPWSPGQELLGGLALHVASPVSTGGQDHVNLEALYPTKGARARFTIDLFKAEPTSSATPKRGALVRRLAEGETSERFPQSVPIDFRGAPDGAYLMVATVSSGEAKAELAQSVYVVRDLAARAAALKTQLKGVTGHETAKAVAEYPFALAEGLRAGARQVISYDFPKALARSAQIARDLAEGKDDVWQAKGLQDRAYAFAPTGELIPYQLYVPSTWTPGRRLPLVVALHGANLDETNMLGRNGGEMQKLAEAHGFIVVAPLGYRLNSGYGSERGPMNTIVGKDLVRLRRSEEDVLQVLAKVEAEYGTDSTRRYLTGNSMGGGGTWWIGARHPELWAAIAPAAFGWVAPEDAPALGKLPIMAVVGDHDEFGMLPRVQQSVAVLEAAGVHPQLVVVPGGTHASAYETAEPRIFDFFSQHAK
jgi:poly(3-hydroxybutyrate) depolymerase